MPVRGFSGQWRVVARVTGLEEHAEGVVISVRARGGARKETLATGPDGRLKISVSRAPERGKANQAIIAMLARRLNLKKSAIELLTGRTASQKRFLIRGATVTDVTARIEAALAE